MASMTDLPRLEGFACLSRQSKITNRLADLIVDNARQEKIRQIFIDEMELGLSKNPKRPSSLQMDNTFVEELINGTEEGEFLALDLGSTNFRVIMVQLDKGQIVHEMVDYYEVSEKLRLGPGSELFDFLASCIADFVTKHSLGGKNYKLGFTFSFPMAQKAINKAYLNTWTKSYKCPGVVGEDVGALLELAIQKRGDLNVSVAAVLNDTTGTLVQGSCLDKNCAIGMILGTGNNGCYIEKASNIEKWEGNHQDQEVIVDIEWGSFGDNGVLDFVRTEWDDALDSRSLLRKSFTFEKYIGGKYLGDLVRETLFTLSIEGLFCPGSASKLNQMGSLKTSSVAAIERENTSGKTSAARETLEKLNITADDDDIKTLEYVCGLISYRAILLVSIICGVLLERMKRPHTTIAIDGSLYEGHPRFQPLLQHLISQYAPGFSFSLMLAKDGSGEGAGLIAAIEERRKY